PQQARRPRDQRRPAGVPGRQCRRHRVRLHDRAVHRRGDRQRPRDPGDAGVGVLDPDLGQRRGPRVDGRERGAPRAGHDRGSRQGAGAGTDDRGAGAGPAFADGRRRSPARPRRRRRARRDPRAHRLPRARPRAGRRRPRRAGHGGRGHRPHRRPRGRRLVALVGFGGSILSTHLWERRKPRQAPIEASAAPTSWIAAILLLAASPAFAGTISGTVFNDTSGNGVRDPGEPGLAGVAVSNGSRIVRTGRDGRYAIDAADGDIVFVIKPAGYAVGKRDDGLPDFWVEAAGRVAHDFALRPQSFPPMRGWGLTVALFTDPQVKSQVDVDYYARDIVADLRDRLSIPLHSMRLYTSTLLPLGITLGDIVNDDLSLYPAINAVTTSLGAPWLHVAGNHDLDAGAGSDAATLATFRRTYGPDTVAWEEPEAVFIGLDDV